ncbi:MAG: hypothetical protein ACLQOO_10055, partial [Terriglobia bacterium]
MHDTKTGRIHRSRRLHSAACGRKQKEEQSSTQSASADCRRRSLNQKHGATLRIGLLNLKDLQTMFP